MLKNEIQILSIVDHPNINRLYETYEDNNYLYLVNEYYCFYLACAKEDNSSIELMSSDASPKIKLGTFLFKWLKLSNTYTFKKSATETSRLKISCSVVLMMTTSCSLILDSPSSGNKI